MHEEEGLGHARGKGACKGACKGEGKGAGAGAGAQGHVGLEGGGVHGLGLAPLVRRGLGHLKLAELLRQHAPAWVKHTKHGQRQDKRAPM